MRSEGRVPGGSAAAAAREKQIEAANAAVNLVVMIAPEGIGAILRC